MSDYPITIEPTVDAPREAAFAPYTSPEAIMRWNQASPD